MMLDTSSVDLGRRTQAERPMYLPIQSLLYASRSVSSTTLHCCVSEGIVLSSEDWGVESTEANCFKIEGVSDA